MSPVNDTPTSCLSTELIPLKPVAEKSTRLIKEVLEFPSSEVYVPHNIYRWAGVCTILANKLMLLKHLNVRLWDILFFAFLCPKCFFVTLAFLEKRKLLMQALHLQGMKSEQAQQQVILAKNINRFLC